MKILSDSGEETFAYNNLGSPTIYRNKQLQWQYGKLLTKYGDTTFEYDGSGRRVRKGEIEYKYNVEGKLISSSNSIYYLYDDKGVAGFVNADGMCLYRKDAQGNIIAILDSAGAVMVRYEYDAWGNHIVLDGNGQEITDPEHIGNVNPYRYRGYFYDVETGLYYLQTRYYDPSIGRFISQDSIEYAAPQSINGLNLYAYCNNNPVMNIDPTGCKEISTSNIIDFVSFMFQFAIGLGLGIVGWAVKTGIRPNNIGIGTYAKYQSQQLANLTKFSNVVSKISTAVAIITVLVTVRGDGGKEYRRRPGDLRVGSGPGVFRTGGGAAVHLRHAPDRRGRPFHGPHTSGRGPAAGAERRTLRGLPAGGYRGAAEGVLHGQPDCQAGHRHRGSGGGH